MIIYQDYNIKTMYYKAHVHTSQHIKSPKSNLHHDDLKFTFVLTGWKCRPLSLCNLSVRHLKNVQGMT